MKKNQVERRLYEKPRILIIGIEPNNCLLSISVSGGHNKVSDDGNELNAKQGWFDEESFGN